MRLGGGAPTGQCGHPRHEGGGRATVIIQIRVAARCRSQSIMAVKLQFIRAREWPAWHGAEEEGAADLARDGGGVCGRPSVARRRDEVLPTHCSVGGGDQSMVGGGRQAWSGADMRGERRKEEEMCSCTLFFFQIAPILIAIN